MLIQIELKVKMVFLLVPVLYRRRGVYDLKGSSLAQWPNLAAVFPGKIGVLYLAVKNDFLWRDSGLYRTFIYV